MSRKLVAIVLLVALGLAGGYALLDGHGPESQYRLAKVESGRIVSTVSASGTVKPVLSVDVTPESAGIVTEVLADFNGTVKAGQVLARLDAEHARSQLDQAQADLAVARSAVDIDRAEIGQVEHGVENSRAQLSEAQAGVRHSAVAVAESDRDFRRMRALTSSGDVPRVESEHARTAYETAGNDAETSKARAAAATAALAGAQAQAQVAEAQLKNAAATVAAREAAVRTAEQEVRRAEIRAPIDGVVTDRSIVVGQTVSPGTTPLFVIVNSLKDVQVHVSVDEADMGRVAIGQDASLSFGAYPDTAFSGKVVAIHAMPQASQNVVAYDVIISADNSAQKLLPGMTADVRIVVDHRDDVVKVPNAALHLTASALHVSASAGRARNPEEGPGTQQVWQLDANGRPRAHSIRTGLTDGLYSEVIDDSLAPGQPVIVGMTPSTGGARVGPLKF
jgi:HlyD family secretion protein